MPIRHTCHNNVFKLLRSKIYIFFICIKLIILSCGTKNSEVKKTKDDLVKSTVKNSQLDSCQIFNMDTTINEIQLKDSKSYLNLVRKSHPLREKTNSKPYIQFASQYNTQTLTLYLHPGSKKDEFAEFEVTYFRESDSAIRIGEIDFYTNNGIMLGINRSALPKFIGDCFESIKENNTEILYYQLNDFENSDFLRRYNYPEYYAEYEFRNDSLIRFKFGFNYP